MKRVIILQARNGSSRLPGKVLMPIMGIPMLSHQLKRLKQCKQIDEIVIATTKLEHDQPIVTLAQKEKVSHYCGSEQDVLSRFVESAQISQADIIVRLTGDCPLIDPQIVDDVITTLIANESKCDYVSNIYPRTFPRGLDVEAFFWDTLLRMHRMGVSQNAREHVTVFLRSERPDLFIQESVTDTQDNSDLRLTVDTENDFEVIQSLFTDLNLTNEILSYKQIIHYIRTSRPELAELNRDESTWSP